LARRRASLLPTVRTAFPHSFCLTAFAPRNRYGSVTPAGSGAHDARRRSDHRSVHVSQKTRSAPRSLILEAARRLEIRGVESAQKNRGESPMNTASCVSIASVIEPTVGVAADLDRLGDQIAELSAHLDAATARLLDLIREFDTRGGWNTGFCSCAAWLTWRVGLDRGAARERVRVARALGTLPRLAQALARRRPASA